MNWSFDEWVSQQGKLFSFFFFSFFFSCDSLSYLWFYSLYTDYGRCIFSVPEKNKCHEIRNSFGKTSWVGDHSRGWPEGSLFNSLLHQGVGEGATPFSGLLNFTLDPYLIMLSVKQGGIKYHFLRLWYDSTWKDDRKWNIHLIIYMNFTHS